MIYVETKEGYVIIPESNVTIQSITSDGENINLQATSSGKKCFDIYAEKGEPHSIKVNDNPITFTYNETTKIVSFCLTFSTKEINISWVIPTTPSGGVTVLSPTCTANWNCSEWSECDETGYQTKICEDLNNCFAITQQTQACEYTPKQEPEKKIEKEILTKEPEEMGIEDKIITPPQDGGRGLTGMATAITGIGEGMVIEDMPTFVLLVLVLSLIVIGAYKFVKTRKYKIRKY
ncbi:MAG: hypothetical protein GOU97_02900 [Nanoarchaeota archaeon]|nr:hypothetical protein [Nanoarchaeota archaeon]